ncbi:MAG: cytochrome c biogenesis protein CcsA [Gemmatimonadota bacterium]
MIPDNDTGAAAAAGPLLRRGPALALFGLAAAAFFAYAQWYGLNTGPERDMGHLQKILYVHVPSAWIAFLSFAVVFLAGVWYLATRSERADELGASAAEVGTLLNGLVLLQGMIWAKPSWGVWWTWDARLSSTLVLFLVFVSYLALRALVDDRERRARWSAVVGILGALGVPVVYMSVRWWRTLHQVQSTPSTMDPAFATGLRLNAFGVLFVGAFLVLLRRRVARMDAAVEAIADERALRGEVDHVG